MSPVKIKKYKVWQAEDEEGELSILTRQIIARDHEEAAVFWGACVERSSTDDAYAIAAAGCPINAVVKEIDSGATKTYTVSGEYVPQYRAEETK